MRVFYAMDAMNNKPQKINLFEFGTRDPLHLLQQTDQVTYLIDYLTDLKAHTTLEEPNYFDRDYLSEFSAFYGISSRGYNNTCRRLHFFNDKITRSVLRRASEGNARSILKMQSAYLGHVIMRPIKAAPLGRTVLKCYPENRPRTPRITEPERVYNVHIAGITLSVKGLAWQQQDTGVGACATIGLWSMLHSSAFDDHHSIPTTTEITQSAHTTASLGSRVFPSKGLRIEQICEAIKSNGLAPMLFEGDIPHPKDHYTIGFSKGRFSSSCASLVRSGYPVLITGMLESVGLHAVCLMGFRACAPDSSQSAPPITIQDSDIEYFYIHDDNIGPNVRFKIEVNSNNTVTLVRSAPLPLNSNHVRPQLNPYFRFTPLQLIVAVHNDLRTSPDQLHQCGYKKTNELYTSMSALFRAINKRPQPLSFSTRFIKLKDYVGGELGRTMGNQPKTLGKVRLSLWEKVPPMSLHIGVLRIGLEDATPLIDVLFDTTDSDRNHPVFCHVVFSASLGPLLPMLVNLDEYGTCIPAY